MNFYHLARKLKSFFHSASFSTASNAHTRFRLCDSTSTRALALKTLFDAYPRAFFISLRSMPVYRFVYVYKTTMTLSLKLPPAVLYCIVL